MGTASWCCANVPCPKLLAFFGHSYWLFGRQGETFTAELPQGHTHGMRRASARHHPGSGFGIEVRSVGNGIGRLSLMPTCDSARRALNASRSVFKAENPTLLCAPGEPRLSWPMSKGRTGRKHRNVHKRDQVSSVLEKVRGPETGSTGRPKEHQHSAAPRRDAGPTAPGEGRHMTATSPIDANEVCSVRNPAE